jgi:hypothetical protein
VTTFHHTIKEAIAKAPQPYAGACADAVLDTPDLLDIRAALWDMSHPSKWLTTDGPETAHRQILSAYFQPHVIDWIMTHGEESTA